MAIPVVTVDFSASVQCGVSPLTVNFTDLTTMDIGFARQWMWNFGDGSISESQNPSHVYTGDPGATYTVTLSVLVTEGEFDVIQASNVLAVRNSNVKITSGGWFDNSDAWDNRVEDPGFVDREAEHKVSFNGVQYFYNTNRPVLQYQSTVGAGFPTIIYLQTALDLDIQDIQGTIHAAGFTHTTALLNTWETMGVLYGILSGSPQIDEPLILPETQLGDPPSGHNWGIRTEFRTRVFRDGIGTQGIDEHAEPDFIGLATAPVPDFSAAPAIGQGPLSVQFTNNTVNSNCGPATTYSWKKRVSGSGAGFVEFSTAENPIEVFTK